MRKRQRTCSWTPGRRLRVLPSPRCCSSCSSMLFCGYLTTLNSTTACRVRLGSTTIRTDWIDEDTRRAADCRGDGPAANKTHYEEAAESGRALLSEALLPFLTPVTDEGTASSSRHPLSWFGAHVATSPTRGLLRTASHPRMVCTGSAREHQRGMWFNLRLMV